MLGAHGLQPRRDGTVLLGMDGRSPQRGQDPVLLLGSRNLPHDGDGARTRWDLLREADVLPDPQEFVARKQPQSVGETNAKLGEVRGLRSEGSGEPQQLRAPMGEEGDAPRPPRYGLSRSWGGRWASAPRESYKTWQDSPFERRASYSGPYWGRRWPYYGPNRFRGYYPRPQGAGGGTNDSSKTDSTDSDLVLRRIGDMQERLVAMDSRIDEVIGDLHQLNERVTVLARLPDSGNPGVQRGKARRIYPAAISSDSGLGSTDSGNEELLDSDQEPSHNRYIAKTALGLLGRCGIRKGTREGHLAGDEEDKPCSKLPVELREREGGDTSDMGEATAKLYPSPASVQRDMGRGERMRGAIFENARKRQKGMARRSSRGRLEVRGRLKRDRGVRKYFIDQSIEGSDSASSEDDDDHLRTKDHEGKGEPMDDSGLIAQDDELGTQESTLSSA